MSTLRLSFPRAQQAQLSNDIIAGFACERLTAFLVRANQRDTYHLFSLRDQTESVLRSWLGTRWLTRWDKEVDLLVKLAYYGLAVGQAAQTLGEEYTDIWQKSTSTGRPPSYSKRAALIFLPTLPAYLIARLNSRLPTSSSARLARLRQILPTFLEVMSEVNLAIFYLRGVYYDLAKRVLGIEYFSSTAEDPHTRPPSYSLLGILLATRLLYRLTSFLRTRSDAGYKGKQPVDNTLETFLDDRPVSSILEIVDPGGKPSIPAEQDEGTFLDISAIPGDLRAGRTCTLCLEERTGSCATDCGHVFCWDCIVGWAREKLECPLCRQLFSLSHLVPIYNL